MDNGAGSYHRFRVDGDETGLVEIIRDYKDGLIFYLNSFVGNLSIAEELAEDTFVLLGTKKPKDRGTGSFKTWLYTIGRHVAIDHLRRCARRREIPLEDCAQVPADVQELEKTYIDKEEKRLVHCAMQKLKPAYRQVLWLIYFEGFSHKQVAAVMKKSVHAVDVLACRARDALKQQLEKEGYDNENL